MQALDCKHQISGGEHRRICQHLVENKKSEFHRHFTGHGLEFDLLCSACRQNLDHKESLRTVCVDCFEVVRRDGYCYGNAGQPEVRERESGLRFHHKTVDLVVPLRDRILDIQPVRSFDQNIWIAVTQAGQIQRIDLDERSATPLCSLPPSPVNLSEDVSLHLSEEGTMAALVNTRGRHGIVLDLESGNVTLGLDRSDEENEHCMFSVAFCRVDGRLLLIHGTEWNRLDISDPVTGMLLTERSSTTGTDGRLEHDMDYFHCSLTVAPNQQLVVDNGWVWHPVGVVECWSIVRWLRENVWESEDGPSKRTLCYRDWHWDGPLCWIDDRQLAILGYGDDPLMPGACIFDAMTGKEERWFPGPKGNLHFDQFLFSADPEVGTAVWDVNTGERLLLERPFCPLRYHPGMKAFLTPLADGRFQLSRLRGMELTPIGFIGQSGTVVTLAQAMKREQQFGGLPVLADALEEAGCTDLAVLDHCRQPGKHGKNCWVVDRILDRSNAE